MNQFFEDIKSKPIFWMGVAIPVVLILHWTNSGSDSLLFILTLLAIIPLAAFLSHATEGIAAKTGDTIGGLLNATMGNLTELVIFIAALRQGLVELLKASIAGAVVTNSLFMLGMSFLQGGLQYKVQNFNRLNAFIQSSMLFVVCIALMIPTIVTKASAGENAAPLDKISLCIAVLLMVIYLLSLLFSLKTHSDYFKSDQEEQGHDEGHTWTMTVSLVVLTVSALCISIVSEIFVEGVQDASEKMGLSQGFVGFIIIPIVGAAAEMMSAFSAARKNKLDISVGIAMGSSAQIALFVTPLMVILSYFIAPVPMDLGFRGGLIFMLFFGTLTVALTSNHGKSTWYLGVLLLSVYAIFGVTLYFLD